MDASGSSSSLSWSSSVSSTSSTRSSGSKRKRARVSHYLRGTTRAPYKSPSLRNSFSPQAPPATTAAQESRLAACSDCAKVLYSLVPAFQAAGMHGPALHNRHSSHPMPKKARTRQHRNISGENEWILANLSDTQGNYKFCYSCILTWIDVHRGRLARLRKVKHQQQQHPLKLMTKGEVEDNKLKEYIVMPELVHVSLRQWWATLRQGDAVTVRYPHGRHGLSGKKSNRQDSQLIEVII